MISYVHINMYAHYRRSTLNVALLLNENIGIVLYLKMSFGFVWQGQIDLDHPYLSNITVSMTVNGMYQCMHSFCHIRTHFLYTNLYIFYRIYESHCLRRQFGTFHSFLGHPFTNHQVWYIAAVRSLMYHKFCGAFFRQCQRKSAGSMEGREVTYCTNWPSATQTSFYYVRYISLY